jgi:hypothetical protein
VGSNRCRDRQLAWSSSAGSATVTGAGTALATLTGQDLAMSEAGEPARRRKPLRRTAWSLVLGGLLATGLMVGTGLLLLTNGTDVGPGRSVTWPAGERASVHKRPGPKDTESVRCVATDGDRRVHSLGWADSARSPIEVTVSCEDAIFLTGTASAIASALQSPLILAPVAVTLMGLPLFFPRFTLAWTRLSNPPSGLSRDWLDRRE